MPRVTGNDLCLGYDGHGHNIVVPHERRLEHLAIFGTTGCGKSATLENIVRSDIRNHPKTGCGMLLIDPHGDVFHGIMQWVAANKLLHLPIIPIDLASQENVINYNVLRHRKCDPTVIIDNVVQAMSYVWGAQGTDQTPLFERWATNILHRLFNEGRTLADAAHLFSRDGAVITDEIHDPLIERDWLEARRNWKGFETDSMSTVNRFRRFLLNPTLRAMFGQTGKSLDFGKALEEGHIVLVSLSRKGGRMSAQNGNLLASLLLADLWTAAAERGKGENKKPFYCVLDEFQRFLSPTLAENLAEARGFGIGMTTACQHPQQLLARGENGIRLYHEVMENSRTKMIFRLSSKENLQPVAEQLCMRTIDPYRVKHQHYQLTTVGHNIEYLDAYGRTSTDTVGGGKQESRTHTDSRSATATWNHTDQENWSDTHADSVGGAIGTAEAENWNEADAESLNETTQTSDTVGGNRTATRHATQTDSETLGVSGKDLQEDGNNEFRERFDEDQARQSWQVAHADSGGTSEAEGSQWQRGVASSVGRAKTKQRGTGGGRTVNAQVNYAASDSHTEGGSSSDAVGGSETEGESDAYSTGTNSNWSRADGNSVTSSPHLIPVLQYEPAAPVFLAVDEQFAIQMSAVARLKDRTALILTSDMDEPVLVQTPTVNRPDIGITVRTLAIGYYQQQSGLAVEMAHAIEQVKARDAGVRSGVTEHHSSGEATTYRRKVSVTSSGANGKTLSV